MQFFFPSQQSSLHGPHQISLHSVAPQAGCCRLAAETAGQQLCPSTCTGPQAGALGKHTCSSKHQFLCHAPFARCQSPSAASALAPAALRFHACNNGVCRRQSRPWRPPDFSCIQRYAEEPALYCCRVFHPYKLGRLLETDDVRMLAVVAGFLKPDGHEIGELTSEGWQHFGAWYLR